jgi:hypothetical protein
VSILKSNDSQKCNQYHQFRFYHGGELQNGMVVQNQISGRENDATTN